MKIMTIIWGLKYAISWLRCIIYELRCTKKNTKHYKVKNKKVLEVLGPSTQVLCYQVQVLPSTFTWSRSQVQVLHQVLIFCTWYQVLKYKYCTWYNPGTLNFQNSWKSWYKFLWNSILILCWFYYELCLWRLGISILWCTSSVAKSHNAILSWST